MSYLMLPGQSYPAAFKVRSIGAHSSAHMGNKEKFFGTRFYFGGQIIKVIIGIFNSITIKIIFESNYFIPEPSQIQSTAINECQGIPEVLCNKSWSKQCLIFYIRFEFIKADREYRCCTGYVKHHACPINSCSQHIGNRVSASGSNWYPGA